MVGKPDVEEISELPFTLQEYDCPLVLCRTGSYFNQQQRIG
jgi:hypothetical protein